MPNYEFHKKIGFITSILLVGGSVLLFNQQVPINDWKIFLIPLVIIFYSNLPDIDHHMGKLRKKTLTLIFSVMVLSSIVIYFIDIYMMLLILMIIGLLGLSLLKVKHRGPMHTYWFVLLAALPLLYIHWFLFVLAFLCSASHILVDRIFSKFKRKTKKALGIRETRNFILKI